MTSSARSVVDRLFAAFGSGDVDALVATVSEDTRWIYNGTQFIPAGVFEQRDGIRTFFENVLDRTEIISFEPTQFVVDGNVVVVLGNEHQRVKRSGRELKQKWVQVYTVENGLIVSMEEFATSEEVAE